MQVGLDQVERGRGEAMVGGGHWAVSVALPHADTPNYPSARFIHNTPPCAAPRTRMDKLTKGDSPNHPPAHHRPFARHPPIRTRALNASARANVTAVLS